VRTDEVTGLRAKVRLLRGYVKKLKGQLDSKGYAYSDEDDSDSATSDFKVEPEDVEVA